MATSVEICNAALMRVGAEAINGFSDNTKRAKLCKNHYDRIKKEMIVSSPWNFCLKRTTLFAENQTFTTTDVAIATEQVTLTAHGKVTGQRVTPSVTTGNSLPEGLFTGRSYWLIVVDANTVKFADTLALANAGTAIDLTSIGVGTSKLLFGPEFGFFGQFPLPSDYLIIFRSAFDSIESASVTHSHSLLSHGFDGDTLHGYQVEGSKLYADEEEFRMIYQADVDESLFSSYFQQALIAKLAMEFSYTMVQSNELKAELKKELKDTSSLARNRDSTEGTPYPMTANEWTNARH